MFRGSFTARRRSSQNHKNTHRFGEQVLLSRDENGRFDVLNSYGSIQQLGQLHKGWLPARAAITRIMDGWLLRAPRRRTLRSELVRQRTCSLNIMVEQAYLQIAMTARVLRFLTTGASRES
jgi:hypothetical protein